MAAIVQNAADAFLVAEDELRAGHYEEALKHYLTVVRGVEDHWRSRFRIADTLLNLKAPHLAFNIYKALAWHSIQAGHPLRGLVAIKMAAAMDRSQEDLIHVVADLYGRHSSRVDRTHQDVVSRVLKKTDPLGDIGFLRGQTLRDEAAHDAAQTQGIEDFPTHLPPIPLFSYLEEQAFSEVLSGLLLKRFVKGQTIIKEGDKGTSFFLLASGNVRVTRLVEGKVQNLARLSYGAVFGEMALVRDTPRTATVTADTDCDLLELSRHFLEGESSHFKSVNQALRDFTHARLLANVAATCMVFKPFPRTMRMEIIDKFVAMRVPAGHQMIREGEEGQGLYLIVKGDIDVTKNQNHLATLGPGNVIGEISLLQKSTTTASCRAKGPCELMFLPRKDFHSLMARHPELKTELSKITAERMQQNKNMPNTDDADLMLIEDDDIILL